MDIEAHRARGDTPGVDVVTIVTHTMESSLGNEDRFIGVFSSRSNASAAVARLRGMPGFVTSSVPSIPGSLQGFAVSEIQLGRNYWPEGFEWTPDPPTWSPSRNMFDMFAVDSNPDLQMVQHRRIIGPHIETCFIGVYRCHESAVDAVYCCMKQPGFRAFPLGFAVLGLALDAVHWENGFNAKEALSNQLLGYSAPTLPTPAVTAD